MPSSGCTEAKGVGTKSVGELLDDLITTNMKIYHLLDLAMTSEDAEAALKANKLNARRNELIRAIDSRLGGGWSVTEKQFGPGHNGDHS